MALVEDLIDNPPLIKVNKTIAFDMSFNLLVPDMPGVYFIHDLRGILYIGRTDNLRRRLNEHYWKKSNPRLKKAIANPVGKLQVSWILSQYPEQNFLEKKFIKIFRPPCNRISYKGEK
jgi:excinuclease UvrABC nuclease subunit